MNPVDKLYPFGSHMTSCNKPQWKSVLSRQWLSIDPQGKENKIFSDLLQWESLNLPVFSRRSHDVHMGRLIINAALPEQIPERETLPVAHVGEGAGADEQYFAFQPGQSFQFRVRMLVRTVHQAVNLKMPFSEVGKVVVGAAHAKIVQFGYRKILNIKVCRVLIDQIAKVRIRCEPPVSYRSPDPFCSIAAQQAIAEETGKANKPSVKSSAL